MVASSEQHSAPVIVINPATAQASSSHPGAPINRADSAEVMKMPEPIIDPITIMVASSGPRARTRPVCCRSSILLLTTNSEARLFSRLDIRGVIAIHARTQLHRVCRHERKSFPRAHRHHRLQGTGLCLHEAFAKRVWPLPPDHAATRPLASAEPVSRRSGNF